MVRDDHGLHDNFFERYCGDTQVVRFTQIIDLIKDLQQEFNMAVLLITHDLPLVRKAADSVSIMHNGRIVEQNKTEALFENPRQDYTRKLLRAIPQESKKPAAGGKVLAAMQDITCAFTVKKTWQGLFKPRKISKFKAVDEVSLVIRQGTTLGIIGESGSGKTQMMLAMLGLLAEDGRVEQGRR